MIASKFTYLQSLMLDSPRRPHRATRCSSHLALWSHWAQASAHNNAHFRNNTTFSDMIASIIESETHQPPKHPVWLPWLHAIGNATVSHVKLKRTSLRYSF